MKGVNLQTIGHGFDVAPFYRFRKHKSRLHGSSLVVTSPTDLLSFYTGTFLLLLLRVKGDESMKRWRIGLRHTSKRNKPR